MQAPESSLPQRSLQPVGGGGPPKGQVGAGLGEGREHSLQPLDVALGVQEAIAQELQACVPQRVVAEVQLAQGGQAAQRGGQAPAARLRQAAVLEAVGAARGRHGAPRRQASRKLGPRAPTLTGQQGWGSPERLDLAGGAVQALEQQLHASIAQLIVAKVELGQGGVVPEGGADVLAAPLRDATVDQPADRTLRWSCHVAGCDPEGGRERGGSQPRRCERKGKTDQTIVGNLLKAGAVRGTCELPASATGSHGPPQAALRASADGRLGPEHRTGATTNLRAGRPGPGPPDCVGH